MDIIHPGVGVHCGRDLADLPLGDCHWARVAAEASLAAELLEANLVEQPHSDERYRCVLLLPASRSNGKQSMLHVPLLTLQISRLCGSVLHLLQCIDVIQQLLTAFASAWEANQ